MSIRGFEFNGVVHKYDYNYLKNIPRIDDTLSISGFPADSKATGDAIRNLQSSIGSPLTASTASEMTDTTKIYVYVGSEDGYVSGNWYYYNGTNWTNGGSYNSVALETDTTLTVSGEAADAKATGDEIIILNQKIYELTRTASQTGDLYISDTDGNAIVEFSNGHIKTKNFDSSNIIVSTDSVPTEDSTLPVQSGGVFNALASKQNTLTFDTTPTLGSSNPVTSNGIKLAIDSIPSSTDSDDAKMYASDSTADLVVSDNSGNAIVQFSDGHIKTKNFDSSNINTSTDATPTEGSTKPVQSGGVYTALASKQDALTFDSTPTSGSLNPVTSDGIKSAIDNIPSSGGSSDAKIYISNSTADLVLSDTSGNVLVQFSDGHMKTKNFDSSDISDSLEIIERVSGTDYAKSFTYDASESTTQTITADFKQGDTILCHLSNTADDVTDFLYARIATYGYIDTNGTQHSLGQEYAYNFGRFVLPENATGIYGTFPSNLEAEGTYTFKFLVYKLSDYERQPNIITVGVDGRRQFTSIRQAMDSFSDNNAYNRYEIWVYPGTYNIMSDFTDDEINADGFVGLWVKNGVKIKGIGHREQIIIHGELSTTDYSSTIRNAISTLNMSGCSGLENLTVTNQYLRYAVHDDHGSGFYQEQTRIIENCKFLSTNAVSGGIGQAAYGAGGHNNKKLIIRNCDLGDRLIIHNTQLMVVPMTAIVENCTAQQVTLTDNNNTGFTAKTRIEFNNCNFDYVLHDRTSDGTDSTMILCGSGSNNIKLDCEANTLYNFGDCMTFPTTISAGQAVKMNGIRTVEATTSSVGMYGISIGNDGSHTYVQRRGYIAAQVLGLTGLSVGDYITLDSNGICISGGTSSNAIGIVDCIASNTSTAFIKLLF